MCEAKMGSAWIAQVVHIVPHHIYVRMHLLDFYNEKHIKNFIMRSVWQPFIFNAHAFVLFGILNQHFIIQLLEFIDMQYAINLKFYSVYAAARKCNNFKM